MIVLTCSGTGGHIYPAIATAQRAKEPLHFIVERNSIATDILPNYNFEFTEIPVSKRFKISYIFGLFKTISFFKKHHVTRCICFGGYATVPVLLAARLMKIPIVLCEQNSLPGKTNRLFQKMAEKICLSFESSKSYFNHPKLYVTGNPLRQDYPKDPLAEQAINACQKNSLNCIIMGGSQGAEFINNFVKEHQESLSDENMTVIHILGKGNFNTHVNAKNSPLHILTIKKCTWIQVPYIENMHILYEWADKVIARAGATTIAELKYYKKDALLIPYPYATDNHQEENAKDYLKTGLGVLAKQDDIHIGLVKRFLGKGIFRSKAKGPDADFDCILS